VQPCAAQAARAVLDSDKNSRKRRKKEMGLIFFSKVGVRIPFSVGNFHFFGRGKTNFGGGV